MYNYNTFIEDISHYSNLDYYICNNDTEIKDFLKEKINVPIKRYSHYADSFYSIFAKFLMSMNKEFKDTVEIKINNLKTDTASDITYNHYINNYNTLLDNCTATYTSSVDYNSNDYYLNDNFQQYNQYNYVSRYDLQLMEDAYKECVLEITSQNKEIEQLYIASLKKYITLKETERNHRIEQLIKETNLSKIDTDALFKVDFNNIDV